MPTPLLPAGPHLFLASKKQYYHMSTALAAVPDAMPTAPNAEAANDSWTARGAASPVAAPIATVGTAPQPSIALCPGGEEVLLACDNTALFLSPAGVPTRR